MYVTNYRIFITCVNYIRNYVWDRRGQKKNLDPSSQKLLRMTLARVTSEARDISRPKG